MPTPNDSFSVTLPALAENCVLCVFIRLPGDEQGWLDSAGKRVTASELAHAARFHQRRDALRHLLGRATARALLARQPGREHLHEDFAVNPWGKPYLAGSDYEFSISHSGDWVCVALSHGVAVGIDIEKADSATDPYLLAEVFHPAESAAIRALPPAPARDAFLRCWTRKEAVVKALGTGLSQPLDSFRVSLDDAPDDWLTAPPPGPEQGWSCRDLAVAAGYRASVAAARCGLFFDFQQLDSFFSDDIRV